MISTPCKLALFVLFASLNGCIAIAVKTSERSDAPAVTAFRRQLADHGSISFRSHNGKAYRQDNDTELTFYANGDACMLDYGLAVEGTWGNYHLHPDGCLTAWFKDARSEWPAMTVKQDVATLLLWPPNAPNGLRPMEPGAASRPAEDHYWRFRMLIGDDEKQVLEKNKKWKDEPEGK